MTAVQNLVLLDGLCLAVLEFDKEDTRQVRAVRAALGAAGVLIGPYNVLIAGVDRLVG